MNWRGVPRTGERWCWALVRAKAMARFGYGFYGNVGKQKAASCLRRKRLFGIMPTSLLPPLQEVRRYYWDLTERHLC